MRITIILVFLFAIAAGAAYMTRPGQGLHRGVASTLMAQGSVVRPVETTGVYAFDDFMVATRSTMRTGQRDVLQCWGFYARFLCFGAGAQVTPPDAA
jgi:hypothetical protein